MTPRLGSTWRNRRTRRIAVVVRAPSRRRGHEYRYHAPVRQRVTLYRRPYTSTRAESVERFMARFEEVRT